MNAREATEALINSQKQWAQATGIWSGEIHIVHDHRDCRWSGTEWSVEYRDGDTDRGPEINVMQEAVKKDGLTFYLGENNGNVFWLVFDDSNYVEFLDDLDD